MFVSVILDVEYLGLPERQKWFFKNISHSEKNDWLVITHEHLEKHYKEYIDNCAERFFDEFEMRRLSDEEYSGISKAFVPDELFARKEKESGSRTAMLMHLFRNDWSELEKILIAAIDGELEKRPGEKVEGIFHCLHSFKSIKNLGKHYGCPVIDYLFSAIRKVHGYRQTLYVTHIEGNPEISETPAARYEKFKKNRPTVPNFSKRELLAMFGKNHNVVLLRLLDNKPKYEIGICREAYNLVVPNFIQFPYTEDDIYYECKNKYGLEKTKTRLHPITFNDTGVGRERMKNDPAAFILSCKRITSIASQKLYSQAFKKGVNM